MYTQFVEAKNTITTIRGKRTHILDDTTGYALCGAGQPNWQFPLGSAIPNKGSEQIQINCYKCKKLSYINSLPESVDVPTREFDASTYVGNTYNYEKVKLWANSQGRLKGNEYLFKTEDIFNAYIKAKNKKMLNLLKDYEKSVYGRRKTHVMMPLGSEGLVDFMEGYEVTQKGKRLFQKIHGYWFYRRDKTDDADIKDQLVYDDSGLIDIEESAADFYLALDANDEWALKLWNKYSPWKSSNQVSKRNKNVEVRTQTRGSRKYDSTSSEISRQTIRDQANATQSSQQQIRKAAEAEIMKIRGAIDQLIDNKQYKKVLVIAKRKDVVGRIALNALLTNKAPEILRFLSIESVATLVDTIKRDRERRAFRAWFFTQPFDVDEKLILDTFTKNQFTYTDSLQKIKDIDMQTGRFKVNLENLEKRLKEFKSQSKRKNPSKALTNQTNLDSWRLKENTRKRKRSKKYRR